MDMYEKEFTADDAKAEIDDVIENGKGYVEQAFNLPYNYFSDESKLVDVDKIIDPEDFEESRIELFANEEFKKNLEMGLINNFEKEFKKKDILTVCLLYGLIDGKPRSKEEVADLLKISYETVRNNSGKFIRKMQRSLNLYPFYPFIKADEKVQKNLGIDKLKENEGELLWFDIPKNPKFQNYGEFLEDYIVHEDSIEVSDKLMVIWLDYVRTNGTGRKYPYKEF